jgi:hypothetical protein
MNRKLVRASVLTPDTCSENDLVPLRVTRQVPACGLAIVTILAGMMLVEVFSTCTFDSPFRTTVPFGRRTVTADVPLVEKVTVVICESTGT